MTELNLLNNDVVELEVGVEPTTEWRHFTYTYLGDSETPFSWLPYYDSNNELTYINATSLDANTFNLVESMPSQENVSCKLPVINGKCEIYFACEMTVELGDNSSGCTLEQVGSWHESEWVIKYKLTITEDNANVYLYFIV